MIYFGIDPGKTTGVAFLNTEDDDFDCAQFENPLHALNWLEDGIERVQADGPKSYNVVVERFVGGGSMTKDGIHTLEVVGFFTYYFKYFHGVEVVRPTSQQRLSGLPKATELAKWAEIEGPTIVQARING
jgi:hypothetical protein